MKPTPAGWPRIASCLYCRDAGPMIDWLCEAYGFEVQLKIEGEAGRIEHSELRLRRRPDHGRAKNAWAPGSASRPTALSPLTAGGNTQNLMVYVDDVDAHCARARAAGAVRIVAEPELHDYGDDYWADRSYGAIDPRATCGGSAQRIRG
jgi:uncharacterized glyoxalase superfamily protein PhnB